MNQDDALKWFAELFGLSPAGISSNTKRADIPAWDSLGVLMLMGGLDETFSIVVNDDDMRSMQRVGDVLDLLRNQGKLRA